MVRNRFDNLDEIKREAILRAAAEEFANKGFDGASINRIIQRSGMSKGSVYYYFEDKSDLFATVVEVASERILHEAGWPALEVVGPDEFWEACLELTRRSVEFVRRDEWWIRIARSFPRLSHEAGVSPALERIREMGRGWWRAIVSRGQVLGVIRTDLPLDLLVEIVMGADEGGDRWMMERWEELDRDGSLDAIVDARVDLLRDMLAKENEGWER
jgi:AcrR family transcriptional regulator